MVHEWISTLTSTWFFKEVILVGVATLFSGYVASTLLSFISYAAKNDLKRYFWVYHAIEVIRRPLIWFIVGSGLVAIARKTPLQRYAFVGIPLHQIQSLFLVAIVIYMAFKIKNAIFEFAEKKYEGREIIAIGMDKAISAFIVVNGVLMTLHAVGLPLQALFAFGGVGGVAAGWAARDVIANFFGGFMIVLNRPFSIGDWIKTPNFEGVVQDIGWYVTKLTTLDRKPIFVPNSLISGVIIENPGRMYNRSINQTIGIRYEDFPKILAIIKDIKRMLEAHPDIDKKLAVLVHFVSFSPNTLDINISAFTNTTDGVEFREIQQDIFIKIAAIIMRHDAQIAYPAASMQQQLQIPYDYKKFPAETEQLEKAADQELMSLVRRPPRTGHSKKEEKR